MRDRFEHLPFLFEREVKTLSNTDYRRLSFATSNFIVRRPTIRSRSTIRSWSSPLTFVAKSSGALDKLRRPAGKKLWLELMPSTDLRRALDTARVFQHHSHVQR